MPLGIAALILFTQLARIENKRLGESERESVAVCVVWALEDGV